MLYQRVKFIIKLQKILGMGTIGDKINLQCCNGKKLRNVNKLSNQQSNQKVCLSQILQKHPGFIGNKSAFYFPYNHIFQDKGWGCAWRAIQMVLSAYKIQDSFIQLFETYGRKQKLLSILNSNKLYDEKTLQILSKSQFAPQDASNNWAQPFICKLVCEDKKVKSRLFLLNGYPYANAPKQVFLETKNFKQFTKIVNQSIEKSPIMIDDGTLAMAIIAYKEGISQHEFIIGDPHILSNRNNSEVGIYKIVCNQQGKQVKSQYIEESIKQAYLKTLPSMHFDDKDWMILSTDGMV